MPIAPIASIARRHKPQCGALQRQLQGKGAADAHIEGEAVARARAAVAETEATSHRLRRLGYLRVGHPDAFGAQVCACLARRTLPSSALRLGGTDCRLQQRLVRLLARANGNCIRMQSR